MKETSINIAINSKEEFDNSEEAENEYKRKKQRQRNGNKNSSDERYKKEDKITKKEGRKIAKKNIWNWISRGKGRRILNEGNYEGKEEE